MTYLFNNQLQAEPTPRAADSFTRFRVSTPLTLFEHNNQYGTNTNKWDKQLTGTGSLVDSFATGLTTLSTGGTAAGAAAVRQTRAYTRFLAGKSLLTSMTFKFGAGVSGVAKRVGFYDTNNGVFLELNGTTLNMVVRSNASGTPTDVPIPMSQWNIDKLDGSGPSKLTFDPNASHNIRFDFIGAFGIRLYFYYQGSYWLVHQNENMGITTIPAPSPTSINLCVRQEIVNLSAAGSVASMQVGNCNVMSEGAVEPTPVFNLSAGNGTTVIAVTARTPVFSLQASNVFGNTANRNYGWIIPSEYSLYTDGGIFYELVLNGTLTGSNFTSVNSTSLAKVDTASTAISGGTVVDSGYVSTSTRISSSNQLQLYFPLVYSSLLNAQDTLTVVVTPFVGNNVHAGSTISWSEYF